MKCLVTKVKVQQIIIIIIVHIILPMHADFDEEVPGTSVEVEDDSETTQDEKEEEEEEEMLMPIKKNSVRKNC